MVATWAPAVNTEVACCTRPPGAAAGSSAAPAGLSKAVAVPKASSATKIIGTVNHPPRLLHVNTAAVSPSAIWQACMTRLRS